MPEAMVINDCWKQVGVWGSRDCPELERHVHCRNCQTYAAAASRVLDRTVPAAYLEQWAQQLSEEKPTEEVDAQSVVIFRISGEWLALDSQIFHEVMEWKPVHSLPHARGRMVLGLVNVRGELLVCVSLAEVLGIESQQEEQPGKKRRVHRLLVAGPAGQRLVFPVDEVHGVHRFHSRSTKPVPATVAKSTATYTRSLLAWRDLSVGWLESRLLFETLNKGLL